ncbi:aliphatic sulfonate ABC transporter substrate-binding protein [Desulfonema magnum]|nr:aliphatic sulfonate ABC transporter substrate-binding protein [Desulfonema magnum]
MFNNLAVTIIILVVLVASALFGWEHAPKKEEGPKTTGKLMKVARNYWPGQYWLAIADKKGWLKEAGLNIEFTDFPDFIQSMSDMAEGKVDVSAFVLFDFMKFRLQGADLVGVINNDISFADAIVAKPGIENITDLKGKRIGLQKESFQEFMLSMVLEGNKLKLDDVIIAEIQAEDTEPFVKGAVDATVTWEPFASEAVEKGNGRIIFDSSELPGLISDIFVFRRKFIKERPEDVQAFVNVWHKSTEFIKQNPKEAFGIIAEIYNKTPGEVEALTRQVKILDMRDNRASFSFAAGFESLHGTARKVNNFMIKKGMTKKRLDSTEFFDGRFIRRLR